MYPSRRFSFQDLFGPLTPAVRLILIATTAVYVAEFVPGVGQFIFDYLALRPQQVLHQGYVWQLVSYLLVHSTGQPMHLVFNMLGLWMFGSAVEGTWGTKRFVQYYLLTGVGAGLFTFIWMAPTIGASGSIFGLIIAFAMLFPEATIIFFIFPMKAMAFAILLIAIEFALLMGGGGGGVSNIAHLGGAAVGWIYIKFSWRVVNWWKARGKAAPAKARRSPRPRRDLVVVPGGGAGGEAPRPRATPEESAIQRRADEILDKISREGMGSVTREEREILQRHSQILKARESDVVNLDDYRS